jgi:hypothetical protein
LSGDIADLAGNQLAPCEWSFTTGVAPDMDAPTVFQTSPIGGSVGIDTKSSLVVIFSKEINPISANAATFIVRDAAGNLVQGTVNCNGAVVTFVPHKALAFKTLYQVTLTSGIEDLAGNSLAQYYWSFTTGWGVVSVTPPSFIRKLPVASVIISATCSEALNLDTMIPNVVAVNLKGKDRGKVIPGTVSLAGNTIFFTPTDSLARNNAYQVTLGTGIQDLTGIPLANEYTWEFRTWK